MPISAMARRAYLQRYGGIVVDYSDVLLVKGITDQKFWSS
jgi:hypothetical protein